MYIYVYIYMCTLCTHIYVYIYIYIYIYIRVVNDTQNQSFETVSNAKFKVSKQYQKLKSFKKTFNLMSILVWFGTMGSVIINKN